MYQVSVRVSLLILSFLCSATSFAKFDSSQLGADNANQKEVSLFESSKRNAKDIQKLSEADNLKVQKELNELYNQLNAMNLISQANAKAGNAKDVLLRRANINIQIAKLLGLNSKSAKQMSEKEKFHLSQASQAIARSELVIAPRSLDKVQVLYMKGLIEFQYDRLTVMIDYFTQALQIDQTSKYSAAMSLMVAEQYFDKEKYEDAIRYYQATYKSYDAYQAAIADYKTAWAYLSTKKFEQAEFYFMRVMRQKADVHLVEDSMKDLAFVVMQNRTEPEIINFGNRFFANPDDKSKFLYAVLLHSYQANPKNNKYELFNEALKLPGSPAEKFKLYSLMVRYERKEYPSIGVDSCIKNFTMFLRQMNPQDIGAALAKDKNLENDIEYIIKIFSEGYLGKIKSPENLSKEILANNLKGLLSFHATYFYQSKKMDILKNLLIDVCADTQDSYCLESIKKELIAKKDPKYLGSFQRVSLELISSLDKMYEKDPVKFEIPLMNACLEFLNSFPKESNSTVLHKKVIAMHLKKDRFKEAVVHTRIVFEAEPTAENLYKFWFCVFNLKDYQTIVKSTEDARFPENQRGQLNELKREASLKLAMTGIEKGDFGSYEANLKQFLSSRPPADKAIVAYVDYFNRLVEKKLYTKLSEEWLILDPTLKNSKEFYPMRIRALQEMIRDSLFTEKMTFGEVSENTDLNYLTQAFLSASSAYPTEADFPKIDKMDPAKKEYYLSSLGLVNPDPVIRYFAQKKQINENEKNIYYLALTLKNGNTNFSLSKDEYEKLKGVAPDKMSTSLDLKTESRMKAAVYPPPGMKAAKYNKYIEDLVYVVTRVRNAWKVEFPTISVQMQVSILPKLIELESKTAEAIANSPPPDNLTKQQIGDYKKGLMGLAEDYKHQSEEYQKIYEGLKQRNEAAESQEKASELPEADMNAWVWPNEPIVNRVRELVRVGNAFGALLFLDHHYGAKAIQGMSYYKTRAGFLLTVNKSLAMRNFVRQELTNAGDVGRDMLLNWPAAGGGFK